MNRKIAICALPCLFAGLLLFHIAELVYASFQPVDALLVLGGTPIRERYAARLEKIYPKRRVLISGGSENPCIWLIFDKAGASKENVWMERCSQNTFENFLYAVPILKSWHVHNVLLLTEEPQSQRALPMAQVLLGLNGIFVDLAMVPNSGGEPLTRPPWMDVALAFAWLLPSQVYGPTCASLTHLPDVNMKEALKRGFYCAPQAEVGHDQKLSVDSF